MATTTPAAELFPVYSTNRVVVRVLSDVCFFLGFASILASISIWATSTATDAGHGERLAIFVGLWAPTFFALSDRLGRYGRDNMAAASSPIDPPATVGRRRGP